MDKCLKVIQSCKTEDQLKIASRYSSLYRKKQLGKMDAFDMTGISAINMMFIQEDCKRAHDAITLKQKELSGFYDS